MIVMYPSLKLICFQNLLESHLTKPFVVPTFARKILFCLLPGSLKKQIKYFHFFPIVKMAANYIEISRLGKLEIDFKQVPFAQIY